ncbi:uncharacterized protein si:ch211-191i18.2 [Micropterus salmoides]|uniref:uncharacterized protein si:ch211-191i18.2 n=1 Tax=Micropterus salmoides TaxID=27706 RepID=UPI0018EE2B0C|nr:uncharacterized protein si:ch211-191i18.2 [Micropterus salmoides]
MRTSLCLQTRIMSSSSLLCVRVSAASLILLLTAVSDAQYYDFTPPPDYDSDYNATFDYSFFSNASSEDLDQFSKPFIDPEEEEEEVTVTIQRATEQDTTDVHGNAAPLPVSLEIRTLVWTLGILVSLLQHTL